MKCSKCLIDKSLDYFYKNKKQCKSCCVSAWKPKANEYARTDQGKAARRKASQKYSKTDSGKEVFRMARKKHKQSHRDNYSMYQQNRMARQKDQYGYMPKDAYSLVYLKYGRRCLKCGSRHRIEMDHVTPLSLGGSHDMNNLQPLCKACNIEKGNRSSADYRKDEYIA